MQLAEFRWILLALGLLLIAGIWWWGGRRSAQAPGNAELRETTVKDTPRQEASVQNVEQIEMHEWEISPFEPLSIKTADFHPVPILDEPMMVEVETRQREPEFFDDAETIPNADLGPVMPPVLTKPVPAPATESIEADSPPTAAPAAGAPMQAAPVGATPASASPITDHSDRISTQAPRTPNTSEKQKIVSVRVCAPAETRWAGGALLAAFELHGLAYGRYQVFHRCHVDGRTLFCVASLVEPGTFEIAQMPAQEFKGITLFAVLPGPVDSMLTLDEMLSAARGLASELPGMLQDAKGAALSPQKVAALREDVAHFQATLPVA